VRPRKDLEQKGNKASTTDNYWIVRREDLIANKLLAWMGAIGVSHYDGVTSPAYDILMPVVDLASDYYHHLFRTKLYLQQFKQRSRGIMEMRLRLYFDQLGQIPVPVPPADEQQAIVDYYNNATKDTDRTIDKTCREIVLFREFRSRLIADVVTGKLDVREAAAKLPDEADEAEPLDEVEALDEVEEALNEPDLDNKGAEDRV
jgi:type I restriction enzyme, S subunit